MLGTCLKSILNAYLAVFRKTLGQIWKNISTQTVSFEHKSLIYIASYVCLVCSSLANALNVPKDCTSVRHENVHNIQDSEEWKELIKEDSVFHKMRHEQEGELCGPKPPKTVCLPLGVNNSSGELPILGAGQEDEQVESLIHQITEIDDRWHWINLERNSVIPKLVWLLICRTLIAF